MFTKASKKHLAIVECQRGVFFYPQDIQPLPVFKQEVRTKHKFDKNIKIKIKVFDTSISRKLTPRIPPVC